MIVAMALLILALLLIFRNSPSVARNIAAVTVICFGVWLIRSARQTLRQMHSRSGDRRHLTYDLARYIFGALCAVLLVLVAAMGGTRALSRPALLAMAAAFLVGYLTVLVSGIRAQAARGRK